MDTKPEDRIRAIAREEINKARRLPDNTPYVRRPLRGFYGLGNLTSN